MSRTALPNLGTRAAVGALGMALLLLGTVAKADPLLFSGTGHYYELKGLPDDGNWSWDIAVAAAQASTYNGMQGHLATITSAEENSFVAGLLPPDLFFGGGAAWLGGSHTPGGTWQWITGEPWGYTNWKLGQPENPGMSTRLLIYGPVTGQSGAWQDYQWLDPQDGERGYVVEYGTVVPLPSTAWMSGIMLAVCAAWQWRQRRVAA
jgi:hypothetical protein